MENLAETLEIEHKICFNKFKRILRFKFLAISAFEFVCVCMRKPVNYSRCCQHRLRMLDRFSCVSLFVIIERVFVFVNRFFEYMFCFRMVIPANEIWMRELYRILCVVKCDVSWTLYMKKLPPGDSDILVGSFILATMKLMFYLLPENT